MVSEFFGFDLFVLHVYLIKSGTDVMIIIKHFYQIMKKNNLTYKFQMAIFLYKLAGLGTSKDIIWQYVI